MPESKAHKIKNVSGSDLTVPALGGRLIVDGATVEVADEADVYGFTCQEQTWAPADAATKKLHEKAHDAQLERNAPPEPEPGPADTTEADPADAEKE